MERDCDLTPIVIAIMIGCQRLPMSCQLDDIACTEENATFEGKIQNPQFKGRTLLLLTFAFGRPVGLSACIFANKGAAAALLFVRLAARPPPPRPPPLSGGTGAGVRSASVCLVRKSAVLVAAAVGEGDTADFRGGGEGGSANSASPVQQNTSAYSVRRC